MKRKIAIDIDDVLLDFIDAFLNFCNSNYGTSFKKENVFSYNLEESFNITREEKNEWMNEFYKSNFFREIKPVEGAQEALNILKKENENIILTSRLLSLDHINMKEITEDSLKRNFEGDYSAIFYSKNHETKGQSKADICMREGISLLMDDCLLYALECNKKGIPSLLMNNPWNQANLEGTLITRVNNWEEVLQELNKN